MQGGGDAEALQHRAGAAGQRVAVLGRDQVFQRREALFVHVFSFEQRLLLHPGRPDLIVAHHDDVLDRHVLVQELVLREHADSGALWGQHLARARRLNTREDAQQRRFTRAVRADDAVAVPRVELKVDLLKQRLPAVCAT